MSDKEYRSLTLESGEEMTVQGYAIVFDAPSQTPDNGLPFNEVITRGALDAALMSDVHLLYSHDERSLPLARTKNGSLTLTVDEKGLFLRAKLPNTTAAKDFYESVKAGLVSGCSFGFKVPKGGDAYDPQTRTRTISRISHLFEVSATPFPAYPQTTLEARSKALHADPARAAALIKCNQILLKEF